MKKILIATSNQGKFRGMIDILQDLSGITFLSLRDFPHIPEPEENGKTFEENAFIKAHYFSHLLELPTISEDSGIKVQAFPEKFGVSTRREIPEKEDTLWLQKFLEMLEDSSERTATFYSCLCFYDAQKNQKKSVMGSVSGIITEFPQAPLEKGIPLSSVFIPQGETDVYAVLDKERYAQISHRGIATRKMREYLLHSLV